MLSVLAVQVIRTGTPYRPDPKRVWAGTPGVLGAMGSLVSTVIVSFATLDQLPAASRHWT